MSPIYPRNILKEQALNGSWETNENLQELVLHIKNICSTFPSLVMAYSADEDIAECSLSIARTITEWGINVFIPDYPVPVSALSYAITTRNMPIGLYIEKNDDYVSIIPISTHGGLFNEMDLQGSYVEKAKKHGVIGSTELISGYVKHLGGFADPFIEEGISYSKLDIPFKELERSLRNNEHLKSLFEVNKDGPIAKLNNNGSHITISQKQLTLSTEELSIKLAEYLSKERFASGTILCPTSAIRNFEKYGEVKGIDGNVFDMNYSAGFSDLFLGMWPDKAIALQGSSCFGDGLLAALYYIEALRSN